MTQDFSFKYYIKNYTNVETYNFKEYFKEKLYLLPDKNISSKKIMELFEISNEREKKIFKDVFLKYFKEKLINDYFV